MNCRIIIGLLLSSVLVISAGAQDNSGLQPSTDSPIARVASDTSNMAVTSPGQPQAPLAPRDLLNAYRQGMQMVFEKTCADLEQIVQAVHSGAITREQAEYSSVERYQLGIMTFQLLRTLYQSTQDDILRASQEAEKMDLQVLGETVLVPPPSFSVDVPEQIVRRLQLSPVQIAAIQAEIEGHRKRMLPLVEQLASCQRALTASTLQRKHDAKHIRALAGEQSRILAQLIEANAQLEVKLYGMLTSEQQDRVNRILQPDIASAKP